MARGSDGKAARVEARKEARKEAKEGTTDSTEQDPSDEIPFPTPQTSLPEEENDLHDENPPVKKKKRKKIKKPEGVPDETIQPKSLPPPQPSIKMGPLILLVMLTGTTLLPALIYAGDRVSAYLQKSHFTGNIGHKLGIGPSPKKRVVSFYEKHDPDKIDDVESILGKYYGDYPKLVKRLERKYGDYGYFLNWEEDEAAMTLFKEQLVETGEMLQKGFDRYAPTQVKVAARNVRFNLGTIFKQGQRVWKKSVWPALEPFFGVPDGAAAQKRKDREEAARKKNGGRRKKNTEFRDEED